MINFKRNAFVSLFKLYLSLSLFLSSFVFFFLTLQIYRKEKLTNEIEFLIFQMISAKFPIIKVIKISLCNIKIFLIL